MATPTKAEQTKGRILDAALAEFAEHGVAGARVDRIAAAAGSNKNLLYVYFGSKEELFAAVLQTHLSRLDDEIPFTPEDLPDFASRVFDWAMRHTELMRLVGWATLERTNPESRAASHDAKIALLEKMRAADAVRRSPFSAAFLVVTVLALATAWSPALPFGTAMHPDRPVPDDVRDQIVTAIERLTSSV